MIKSEYNEIVKEFFDLKNIDNLSLLSLDESEQDQAVASLATKLYKSIVGKVTKIDFGEIPKSKGDITRIPKFVDMMDCLNTMNELLIRYKQSTKPVDIIFEAIENLKNTKDIWEKAFHTNSEFGMIFYNNIALCIVSSTSLLISSSVDYIKDPTTKEYQMFVDKVSSYKTAESMMFKNLEKFNKGCAKGEIQKVAKSMNEYSKNLDENAVFFLDEAEVISTMLVVIPSALLLLKLALPIIQELTSIFFNAKQSVSDYFAVQAKFIELNAQNVPYVAVNKSYDEVNKIVNKQLKIAAVFKKISNTFAVKMKTAEKKAIQDISQENKKFDYDDIKPSSIF